MKKQNHVFGNIFALFLSSLGFFTTCKSAITGLTPKQELIKKTTYTVQHDIAQEIWALKKNDPSKAITDATISSMIEKSETIKDAIKKLAKKVAQSPDQAALDDLKELANPNTGWTRIGEILEHLSPEDITDRTLQQDVFIIKKLKEVINEKLLSEMDQLFTTIKNENAKKFFPVFLLSILLNKNEPERTSMASSLKNLKEMFQGSIRAFDALVALAEADGNGQKAAADKIAQIKFPSWLVPLKTKIQEALLIIKNYSEDPKEKGPEASFCDNFMNNFLLYTKIRNALAKALVKKLEQKKGLFKDFEYNPLDDLDEELTSTEEPELYLSIGKLLETIGGQRAASHQSESSAEKEKLIALKQHNAILEKALETMRRGDEGIEALLPIMIDIPVKFGHLAVGDIILLISRIGNKQKQKEWLTKLQAKFTDLGGNSKFVDLEEKLKEALDLSTNEQQKKYYFSSLTALIKQAHAKARAKELLDAFEKSGTPDSLKEVTAAIEAIPKEAQDKVLYEERLAQITIYNDRLARIAMRLEREKQSKKAQPIRAIATKLDEKKAKAAITALNDQITKIKKHLLQLVEHPTRIIKTIGELNAPITKLSTLFTKATQTNPLLLEELEKSGAEAIETVFNAPNIILDMFEAGGMRKIEDKVIQLTKDSLNLFAATLGAIEKFASDIQNAIALFPEDTPEQIEKKEKIQENVQKIMILVKRTLIINEYFKRLYDAQSAESVDAIEKEFKEKKFPEDITKGFENAAKACSALLPQRRGSLPAGL